MSIAPTIYARLSQDAELVGLVNGQILPSEPATNQAVPHLWYTVTSSTTSNTTDGPSDLTLYSFAIDAWAVHADDLFAIMERVETVLHGWRAGFVQHCTRTGSSTDKQENGYHGQLTFDLWKYKLGSGSSPGTVATGDDYAELTACSNTLRVDCDGLTLNGEPVGGGPVQVTTVTTTYTATEDDEVIFANATAAPFTVTLPAPAEGDQVTVKKIDQTTNLVTVEGPGDILIDGSGWAELHLPKEAMTFTSDGTGWYITGVVAVT